MKKFRYFILNLVCFVFFLVPIRSMATDLYGSVYDWDGVITTTASTKMYLTNIDVQQYNYTDSSVTPSSTAFVYSGTVSDVINFTNLDPNTYINGSVTKRIDVSFDNPATGITYFFAVASMDPIIMDGLYISMNPRVISYGGNLSFDLIFTFDNYYNNINEFKVPIDIYIELSCFHNSGTSGSSYINPNLGLTFNPVEDYTGSALYYTDPRDLPGELGFITDQNQQIIDGVHENTSAINNTGNNIVSEISDAATYIGNQIKYYIELFETSVTSNFNQLTSNLANWYNGMTSTLTNFFTPYFDNITDAFKKALSDTQSTDNDVLSGAMDDYQAAEQVVFSPAMDSLTEFDFESHNISSLGTGFVAAITFVSSCLTNMYDLTPFSVVFEVIATLGLASICIGLSRLWFGKKGR